MNNIHLILYFTGYILSIVFQAAYTRSLSDDKVRRIVNEEGRQARNLVTWNVPVDDSDDSENEGKKEQLLLYS